jgi:hypothetical protein
VTSSLSVNPGDILVCTCDHYHDIRKGDLVKVDSIFSRASNGALCVTLSGSFGRKIGWFLIEGEFSLKDDPITPEEARLARDLPDIEEVARFMKVKP